MVGTVRLFLAFTLIPIAEMYLLIRIGSQIGAMPTIAVVILTALLGASLTRIQGFRTLGKIQDAMARGAVPAEELFDGVLIFAAGLVLITPGFLTDAIGFALLLPPSRNAFKRWLRRRVDTMISRGEVRVIVSRHDDL